MIDHQGLDAALRKAAELGGDEWETGRNGGNTGMTERRVPHSVQRGIFRLTVSGNPIPKGRPGFVDGHAYTPKATRNYETLVKDAAALAWPLAPMTGPLTLELVFYRANRRRADFDNLTKAVVDALQGIVLLDDNQIVTAFIQKRVDRISPRVEIMIREV